MKSLFQQKIDSMSVARPASKMAFWDGRRASSGWHEDTFSHCFFVPIGNGHLQRTINTGHTGRWVQAVILCDFEGATPAFANRKLDPAHSQSAIVATFRLNAMPSPIKQPSSNAQGQNPAANVIASGMGTVSLEATSSEGCSSRPARHCRREGCERSDRA
jgi:hypothetical protein